MELDGYFFDIYLRILTEKLYAHLGVFCILRYVFSCRKIMKNAPLNFMRIINPFFLKFCLGEKCNEKKGGEVLAAPLWMRQSEEFGMVMQ